MKARFHKLHANAVAPTKANLGDVAWDFTSIEGGAIEPGRRKVFKTGIQLELPEGYGLILKERSGMSVKHGLRVLAGVIDNGYRGELLVCLLNTDDKRHFIEVGDRICQGYIQKIENIEWEESDSELSQTDRGNGGFGSSGK